MAWYSDEEYAYRQDCKEKAITARSARYKRTHCGKGGAVKFPSDYMTAKEKRAMNGEVKTYNISKPMTWVEFKGLPDDLKKGYIKMLRHRFEVPDKYIAEMMGTTGRTLGLMLADLGCRLGKGHNSGKWPKEIFEAWCSGVEATETESEPTPVIEEVTEEPTQNTPVEPVVDAELMNGPEQVVEDEIDILIPESGQMTFKGNIDQILAMVKRTLGNSNVELTVNWTIMKEE